MVPKRNKWPDWLNSIQQREKKAFLLAFSACGKVTTACEQVGIDRVTEWLWRQKDAEYAAVRETAWQIAVEGLEAEAYRRGHDGVEEPVFHGGERCGAVRKYSDTLLIFMLKGAKPDTYRDQWKGEISGPNGGPIRTAVDLSRLTEEELATLERIANRAAESSIDLG